MLPKTKNNILFANIDGCKSGFTSVFTSVLNIQIM